MPKSSPEQILAFDFGLKRIGVAVGQQLLASASPLDCLYAKQGVPDWQQLQQLINTWRPDALMIGIPLNMDGTEQAITAQARLFAKELETRFGLSIILVDERLTTKEARAQLFAEQGFKGLQKGKVDSMAAKVMLEGWWLKQPNNYRL